MDLRALRFSGRPFVLRKRVHGRSQVRPTVYFVTALNFPAIIYVHNSVQWSRVSMKPLTGIADEKAAAMLRVASYLGRPQKFMAVAEARAEMRRTLDEAAKGSVVLTTHGEPQAAVVNFTTLEDMRRTLMHLLVEKIGSSLARTQERVRAQRGDAPVSGEEELEALVGEALRGARQRSRKHPRKVSRG